MGGIIKTDLSLLRLLLVKMYEMIPIKSRPKTDYSIPWLETCHGLFTSSISMIQASELELILFSFQDIWSCPMSFASSNSVLLLVDFNQRLLTILSATVFGYKSVLDHRFQITTKEFFYNVWYWFVTEI